MCEAIITITGIALGCMASLVLLCLCYTPLHAPQLREEEVKSRDEKGTQTAPTCCVAGEVAVLLGGGVSQPEAVVV